MTDSMTPETEDQPRTGWGVKTWIAAGVAFVVVAVVVGAVLVSVFGSDDDDSAGDTADADTTGACIRDDGPIDGIVEGFNAKDVAMRGGNAVELVGASQTPLGFTYVFAGTIESPRADEDGEVAVWALTTLDDGAGRVLSVNEAAKAISRWGGATTPDSAPAMAIESVLQSAEFDEVVDCAGG